MPRMAFLQARMGSTRLPGKILEPIEGQPSLLRIVERLRLVSALDDVVVLTSTDPTDDRVQSLCAQSGVRCLRGHETDVLDRFHSAAEVLAPEELVRITGDCPLVDPGVVSELISLFNGDRETVYASVATGAGARDRPINHFPDGLDAEIMTADLLERAWREATDPFDREHVTPFIWRQPALFPAATLACELELGHERWTVDYPADLAFVREVYARLQFLGAGFGWREILAELERDPALREINAAHVSGLA